MELILFERIGNLIISDGTTPNTNVTISQPFTNLYNPIKVGYGGNIEVHDIDFINTRVDDPTSIALKIYSCNTIIFQNNVVKQFNRGIQVSRLGNRAIVTDNDFRGTGYFGIYGSSAISLIASSYTPRELYVADNMFGLDGSGDLDGVIFLGSFTDLIVSDGSIPNSNVIIQSGLDLPQVLSFEEVKNISIQNLNILPLNPAITFPYSEPITGGIRAEGTLLFKNNQIQKRSTGLSISIADSRIQNTIGTINCNTFIGNEIALDIFAPSAGITWQIENNNFLCNEMGILSALSPLNLAFENNFWGSSTGPSNLGGYGDSYNVGMNSVTNFSPSLFTCAPTPAKPTITVEGNGIALSDNIVSVPSLANGTDFGLATDCSTTQTFTLKNTGILPLEVSSIEVLQEAGSFYVSNITFPVILAASSETTFDVTFAAQNVGILEATIKINSNDCSSYSFAVKGEKQLVTSSLEQLDKVIPVQSFNASLGQAVAVSGDYAVVGHHKDNQRGSQAGAAYVYKRQGNVWVQQQKLIADDGLSGDNFGYSVDILGDIIVVGAKGADWSLSRRDVGAVYVFRKNQTSNQTIWEFVRSIERSFFQSIVNENFGSDVSLSEDYLVVGASGRSNAYIYRRVSATSFERVGAPSPANIANFGEKVSVEGNYTAIGAKDEANGFVYIYKYNGTFWELETKITRPDATHFGRAVSVSNDKIAVGADGKSYIYSLQGGVWTEETSLVPTDTHSAEYGSTLKLQGNSVVVGDKGNTENSINSGATYLFSYQNNAWTQTQKIVPNEPSANQKFGNAVGFSAGNVLVASIGDNLGNPSMGEVGSAYFFGYKTESDGDAGIEVLGNSVSITNNQTTTSASDSTFLGIVTCSDTVNTIYTINSTGAEDLVIEKIELLNNVNDFRINNLPSFPFTLAAGQSYPLWITFDPQNGGVKESKLNIVVDNCSIADFKFAIKAEKVRDNVEPVLDVPADTTIFIGSACSVLTSQLNLRYATATDNCTQAIVSNNLQNSYEVGTYTINWIAYDMNGNSSFGTQSLTIKDDVFPTITAPNDITVCGGNNLDLGTPTSSDNCSVASVVNDAPSPLPVGTTLVTWTATDNAGNISTDTQTIIIEADTELPVIVAPADITISGYLTYCFNIANLGTPITSDNCGIASVDNDDPIIFYVGTTIVTWTVTDNAGNVATATQNVTLVESILPTITAPAPITINTDLGACTASNVALGTPITGDNCGVASTTNDAPTLFPIGTTIVTWTVTDNSGNVQTAIQIVTVVETELPTITAPTTVNTNTDAGSCTASNVNLGTPITNDNCGIASTTNDAPTLFPIGTTTITWTTTDNSGNTATATQNVIVTGVLELNYSATTFTESTPTSGQIGNTLSIYSSPCGIFEGTNGEDFVATGKAVVTNIPAGLGASIVYQNNGELAFSLLGTATSHTNADDVNDLTVLFNNTAFIQNVTTTNVTNFSVNNLQIDFLEVVGGGGNTGATTGGANPVTNLDANASSTTQNLLTWTLPIGTVTGYRIYRNGVLIATLTNGTLTSYLDENLNPDVLYSYEVIAVNGNAISQPTFTRERTLPANPILISVTEICEGNQAIAKVNSTGSIYRLYENETSTTPILESNNATIQLPLVSQTTMFYITVFSNGRESTKTAIQVTVQPAFTASINGENERISCENSATLEAQIINNATSYVWFRNGIEVGTGENYQATFSGNYQVRIQRGNCLETSQSVNVKLNYAPLARIQEQNNVRFCENGTINISNSALQANQNATYQWLFNGNVIGTENNVEVSQSGNYTLKATKNGCSSETTINVTVTDLPSELVMQSSANTFCPNTDVTLTTQSIPNVTYEWFRNGRLIVRNGTNEFTTQIAGKYEVKISQNNCELISNETEIEILDVPTTYLRTSETTLFVEEQNGNNQNIASVSWKLNGEVIPSLEGQTTITPEENGSYSAIVIYQTGCETQTRTVSFRVQEEDDTDVITGQDDIKPTNWKVYPNPSADGNFVLEFDISLTEDTEINIFDATGRIVYTQSLKKGSNKKQINLSKMAQGMYVLKAHSDKQIFVKQLIIN